MAVGFDAYHKWLGIPPAEQPANFYRLLALNPFESNPDVIEAAADARTAHLRSLQPGPHVEWVQKLLNQIAAARLCLLRPEKRASYDAALRAQMARTAGAQAQRPAPVATNISARATPLTPAPVAAESGAALLDFISTSKRPTGTSVDLANRPSVKPAAAGAGSKSNSVSASVKKPIWPRLLMIFGPIVGIAAVAAAIVFRNSQDADDLNAASNIASVAGVSGQRTSDPGSESTSGGRPIVKPLKKGGDEGSPNGSAQPLKPVAYLDDLHERDVIVGHGTLGKHGLTGYPDTDPSQRVRLDGKDVQHALSMHPAANGNARASYSLGGKYQSFTTLAAIMEASPNEGPPGSPLQFRVLGDAKILWSSPKALQQPGEREECVVSVRGVMLLTLEVICPGDMKYGHAVWIDPWVSIHPPNFNRSNSRLASDVPKSNLPTDFHPDIGSIPSPDSPKPDQPKPDQPKSAPTKTAGNPEPTPAAPPPDKPVVDTRSPVPDAAAQQKALAQLREVLKDDYAKAVTSEARVALAQKLAKLAGDEKDDSALRYVMATQALEAASKVGEARLASDVVAGLCKFYVVDAWDLRAKTLAQLSHSCKTPEQRADIARAALDLVDKAEAEERWDTASELATVALNMSGAANAQALRDQARDARERIRHVQKLAEEVKAARKKLTESADDPDANLVVGRFLCLQQDNWQEGLPHLAKGSDPLWKEIASQEQSSPSAPEAQVTLADAWWNAADKRPEKKEDPWFKPMRARAVYWYRESEPGLKGLALAKMQKRIAEVEPNQAVVDVRGAPNAYLDDLKESSAIAMGEFGKHGLTGYHRSSTEPKWVRVGRIQPQHAIAMWLEGGNSTQVEYQIEGKYRKFSAVVAIPDSAQDPPPVVYQILGDGRSLWLSPPLRKSGDTVNVTISVQGINTLQIAAHNRAETNVTAVYLNPLLSIK